MTRNRKIMRISIPILFIILCSFLLVYSAMNRGSRVYNGLSPQDFPSFIMWFIIVLSAIDLLIEIRLLVKDKGFKSYKDKGEAILPFKAFLALCTLSIYAFLWEYIGFTLSTAIYVTLVGKYLRKHVPWWICIVVGVGFAILMYVLFQGFFGVMLPDVLVDGIRYGF